MIECEKMYKIVHTKTLYIFSRSKGIPALCFTSGFLKYGKINQLTQEGRLVDLMFNNVNSI